MPPPPPNIWEEKGSSEGGQDLRDSCWGGHRVSKQVGIFSKVSPLPRMTQGKALWVQGLHFLALIGK